ncbi:hypothetical protein ACPYPG_07015 [Streptomyces sp. FR-108]|uniref:hypothetical protein n=1 Tax=unclassified Streptomyces TaxID=2593676 RepID=UPI003687A8F0
MSHTTAVTLAAGDLSQAVGPISATGLALLTGTMLVLGVVGKGKKKLASGPAQLVGMLTELAFLRSGAPFHDIGTAFQSIPQGIAETPGLGAPGLGAVCLLLIVLSLFARIVPVSGALLGLMLGGAFDAADGSIWHAIVSILTIPFGLLGA